MTNASSIPKSVIPSEGAIYSGQDVIFLGFPQGIGSFTGYNNTKSYSDIISNPLIRKGIISWISNNSKQALIDGFSFGGNSGSPIFSVESLEQTKYVGMVNGHLGDRYNVQNFFIDTTSKKIIPTEQQIDVNNGLANFTPAYVIQKFLDEILLIRPKRYK